MSEPTDREVVNEKARQARKVAKLKRMARELKERLDQVEIENIGYAYAIQTLRYNMGLDNTKTDLRECMVKYNELKAKLDHYAVEHPTICYQCAMEVRP